MYNYKIIVFRVHSAIIQGTNDICLFTSEPFGNDKASSLYFKDVVEDKIVRAFITPGGPKYFAIAPAFVKHEMKEAKGAIIVMMGCDTLKPGYLSMAKSFIEKGAEAYIGWSGPVTLTHSDKATLTLLSFLVRGYDIKTAIIKTMNIIGPDPIYGSELLYL